MFDKVLNTPKNTQDILTMKNVKIAEVIDTSLKLVIFVIKEQKGTKQHTSIHRRFFR